MRIWRVAHPEHTLDGFIVYVYEVPEDYVRVGKFGQALFNWTAAEEIFNFELFEEEAA